MCDPFAVRFIVAVCVCVCVSAMHISVWHRVSTRTHQLQLYIAMVGIINPRYAVIYIHCSRGCGASPSSSSSSFCVECRCGSRTPDAQCIVVYFIENDPLWMGGEWRCHGIDSHTCRTLLQVSRQADLFKSKTNREQSIIEQSSCVIASQFCLICNTHQYNNIIPIGSQSPIQLAPSFFFRPE